MIYYAAYYSTEDSGRVKNYAGEDKVDYICQALNEIGEEVLIISNAKTLENRFAKKEKLHLFQSTNLLYFSSLPRRGIILHAIDVLWGYIQLVLYVLYNIKKTDSVIVYHSLGYRGIWGLLRKLKKFNYILEVEELFQAFDATKSSYKKKERKVFKHPDAFMFSSELLAEDINIDNKPSVIINGIYKKEAYLEKIERNIIKVVYAGSLEKQKGVDYIIPVAEFLPKEYEIHIIGFGSSDDIKRIEGIIKTTKGNVSYDGVFKGMAYIDYLQKCDIGVCIQDENDVFNRYEYPSKIFSYISNGLQVIANDLIQLRKSKVFPYLHIVYSKKPQDIARRIKSCMENKIDSEDVLKMLDRNFKEEIQTIIRR